MCEDMLKVLCNEISLYGKNDSPLIIKVNWIKTKRIDSNYKMAACN